MKNLFIALILLLFLEGCYENDDSVQESEEETEEKKDTKTYGYEDGTYCADVEYYYSKTGTRSKYTLKIEIEDNYLVKILWPNGGWLDDSHYTQPEIDDGTAEFTSDAGVEYTVEVTGKEDDCDISNNVTTENNLVNQYNDELDQEEAENQRNSEEQEESENQENNN
jgi:hypothetical protein